MIKEARTTSVRFGALSKIKWQQVAAFLLVAAIALVFFIPFAWMVSTSLKPDLRSVLRYPPEWIPRPPTLANFPRAWAAARFSRYMMNSLVISLGGVGLQVINGSLCAYVFSRIHFRGREFLFLMFLVVMMIPSQVVAVPNYIMISRLGWLDSFKALIIPFSATAFGTFLLRTAFLSVPDDLVDAAVIDGANHLQIMRHVMVPLSKPTLLTFFVLNFNWRWNDYFWPLIMTNSDKMRTVPLGLNIMRQTTEGGTNWHVLMAATILALLPVLTLFLFFQRYFIEGISRSGLKGV